VGEVESYDNPSATKTLNSHSARLFPLASSFQQRINHCHISNCRIKIYRLNSHIDLLDIQTQLQDLGKPPKGNNPENRQKEQQKDPGDINQRGLNLVATQMPPHTPMSGSTNKSGQ